MTKRRVGAGAPGDDLGAMIRAAGAEDAAAAASEFPFSPEVLHGFVGGVRRRRAAGGAALALVLIPVLGGVVFGVGQLGKSESIPPIATPSVSFSPSTSPSASPSPSVSPSPTAGLGPVVTEGAPQLPDPSGPAVPGRITGVSVWPGGSPGAIQLEWHMLVDVNGYRVYRSASPNGPFTPAASVLYDRGHTATTIEIAVPYEQIRIGFYSSEFLTYTEIVDHQPACFQVAGFNSVGEGRRSVVVCGNPEAPRPEPDPSTPPPPDPSTPPAPDPSTPSTT